MNLGQKRESRDCPPISLRQRACSCGLLTLLAADICYLHYVYLAVSDGGAADQWEPAGGKISCG
jgi:hypothetical protein